MTASKPSAGSITVSIKVVPRASKNQIVGREGDAVKVRLNAPPVDGKANEALVKFLAASFGVRLRQVEIVAGATSRHKVVRISGVTANQLEELIPK
ncbi:MAG TPA: DUF167 domain-containing protein [Anaerolineae bacterium]